MNHTHEPYGNLVWDSFLNEIRHQFMNCKCGELLARNTTLITTTQNWTEWKPQYERGN